MRAVAVGELLFGMGVDPGGGRAHVEAEHDVGVGDGVQNEADVADGGFDAVGHAGGPVSRRKPACARGDVEDLESRLAEAAVVGLPPWTAVVPPQEGDGHRRAGFPVDDDGGRPVVGFDMGFGHGVVPFRSVWDGEGGSKTDERSSWGVR